MYLRQITKKDQLELKKVYFDSIISLEDKVYNREQKIAWSSQAWDNPEFEKTFNEGEGWLILTNKEVIAFAIRYPKNRIALFYCKGNSRRKGYGTILLKKLEYEAKNEGLKYLLTEASLISYALFLRNSWYVLGKEKIIINNKIFERYKMKKTFK